MIYYCQFQFRSEKDNEITHLTKENLNYEGIIQKGNVTRNGLTPVQRPDQSRWILSNSLLTHIFINLLFNRTILPKIANHTHWVLALGNVKCSTQKCLSFFSICNQYILPPAEFLKSHPYSSSRQGYMGRYRGVWGCTDVGRDVFKLLAEEATPEVKASHESLTESSAQ